MGRPDHRLALGKPKSAYPSVTTILSTTKDMTHLNAWKRRVGHAEAQRIVTKASSRGTSLHNQLEEYFENSEDGSGVWWDSIEPQLKRIRRIKWLEEPVHFEHAKLAFFGIADCLAYFDDRLTLIDWKTARSPRKEEWIFDYKLQAAAYAAAVRQMVPALRDELTQTAIVISVANEADVDSGKAKVLKSKPAQVFLQTGPAVLGAHWRAFMSRNETYRRDHHANVLAGR